MASYSGFNPYQQELPPAGYYDPSLDAQQGAASRGLFDLGQDSNTQNLRDTTDYGLGLDSIQRGQTRGNEDLASQRAGVTRGYDRNSSDINTGYGRNVADLNTASARGQQDYDSNVQALTRRYGQLGDTQRQGQAKAGVMRGGAMLQAAAKRTANEAIDRQPMDTSFQRFQTDQSTQLGRLGEDKTLGLSRLGEDRDTAYGQLDTAGRRLTEDSDLSRGQLALQMAPPDANNPYGGRSFQDRTTQLTRAQREGTAFGLDTTAAKAYQAAGAGWTPPSQPGNEFVDPATGQHRQVRTVGNQMIAVDPKGKVLWRRPRSS